jgi:hypothetical protein
MVGRQHTQLKKSAIDGSKFMIQLKAKGMKHSERALKMKAKLAVRGAKVAERMQSKKVCCYCT